MTFSILTFDRSTGTLAAAAATGSLCVGGWVIRGDIEAGLSASQGTAPSTFWRDDVIRQMRDGASAQDAVKAVTGDDPGRDHRQIIAMDRSGQTHGFTGARSVPFADHWVSDGLAVGGNMLAGNQVLEAMRHAAHQGFSTPADRMLAVLRAAKQAGGDVRGLKSAALLVLSPDHPPLDLRIDHDDAPVDALTRLCKLAHQSPYVEWLSEVPVLSDRTRVPDSKKSTEPV